MYSLVDIAPTAASILNISLPKRDGVPIPAVVRELDKCSKLILIIVDGLGFSTYETYKHYFDFGGMVFKCKAVSSHTTPAIATILTGLHPTIRKMMMCLSLHFARKSRRLNAREKIR